MSSKVVKGKKSRKVVTLHCRKISSTSNRSQMSFSRVNAVSGIQKRRITALLKSNKALANALEDVRYELSYKENLLKDCAKNLNNIMYARVKMLNMQSSLKSFIEDFEETLLLLKQDDTKWPVVGLSTQSRADFKRNMKKNPIDAVEEASETDSMHLDHETNSNNIYQAHDHDTFNFEVIPTESQMELRNKPNQESEQMIENVNANVLIESQVQLSKKCMENEEFVQPCEQDITEKSNDNCVLPINEILGIKSIDYMKSRKECENSGTPKLSLLPPALASPIDLNPPCDSEVRVEENTTCPLAVNKISDASVEPPAALSPVKAKCSKIPRMLDFSQKKQKKCTIDTLSRENVSKDKNSAKETANVTDLVPKCFGTSISFAKKTNSFTKNLKSLDDLNEIESNQKRIPFHNNENILNKEHINFCQPSVVMLRRVEHIEDENFIKETEDVKELNSTFRRGTFFVKKTETVTNDLKSVDDFYEAESNDKSSPIHKHENNMVEEQEIFSRRKTFVIKTAVNKNGHETKGSDRRKTYVKKLDTIEENVPSKNRRGTFVINDKTEENINCNEIDMVACSASKNVQNETVTAKNVHEIPVNLPVVDVTVHKSSISTVKGHEHNMKFIDLPSSQNHLLESKQALEKYEVCEINTPIINNAPVFDDAANQRELLNDANKSSVENNFNQVKEKGTENVKVAKNLSKDNESDTEAESDIEIILNEIQNVDDITIFDTPKRRKQSCFHKHSSYKDFLTLSESECESLSDIDCKSFKQISVIKKTPIRKQIPVNKKKVFVFNANKRKSTLDRKRCSISSKIQENCSTVQSKNQSNDDAFDYQSNSGNMDYVSKSNPLFENAPEKSFKSRKSVTFTNNISYSETSVFNSQSKISKNDCTQFSAQPNLKVPADVKDSPKIAKESAKKNVTIKKKDSTKLYASNYKENIHPQDIRKSNQIGCIDTHKLDEENNSNEVVESTKIHCSDVIGKVKPKKSEKVKKNVKRRKPFDDILEKDLISGDKKIKKYLTSVDDIISVSSNIDIVNRATENVLPKKHKKKSTKKKVKKNSLSKVQAKNTFLVHAEIHPPPPGLNISQTEKLPEEKKETEKHKLRLSVVLSDIFQSEDGNKLNICDKNLLCKDRTSFPLKTLLSDKVRNIQMAEITHQDNPNLECNLDEIRTIDHDNNGRRFKKPVSYKEPLLNKKMRR